MISKDEIEQMALSRQKDAKALLESGRFGGAIYLFGYVIELALKLHICKTLNWDGYPSSKGEFRDYTNFRTHNLDVLLSLSGAKKEIKTSLLEDWSKIAEWDPKMRYENLDSISKEDACHMDFSVSSLLNFLLRGGGGGGK